MDYWLMLKDDPVLFFNMEDGECQIRNEKKLPYEMDVRQNPMGDFKSRLYNVSAIQNWCANRTLSMSQKHAKAIRNALNLSQDDSDTTKSRIAISYHCLSLDDSYWVKKADSETTWEEVNLFHNPSRNALTPVSLKGTLSALLNGKLKNSSDLGVDGTFAKSWVRDENGILYLLKADDSRESRETVNEVSACKVLDCFNISHAEYSLSEYDGIRVSKSKLFTDENHGLVKYKAFKKYCKRHGLNPICEIERSLFAEDYYKMCVATYLIGNEDLHDGNWGFLQDAGTGEIAGFAPLYDFNYAFTSDYVKGADSLSFVPENRVVDEAGQDIVDSRMLDEVEYHIIRKRPLSDAAKEAIGKVHLVQTREIASSLFPSREHYLEFQRRCRYLNLTIRYAPDEQDMDKPYSINGFFSM